MVAAVLSIRSAFPLGEELARCLREGGTLGIWEISDLEWRAYFPCRDPALEPGLLFVQGGLRLEWSDGDAVDWAARYQESLRPIPIGRRFAILPSPELSNPWPGRIPLRLVPGMAFGTGEHFTSASCLRALEDIDPAPSSVLDVGCGTGILAAAAWKLGSRTVVACDTDPEACAVSRETALANDTPFEILEGSADAVKGTYQLCFANILAQTLIQILPDLRARLSPGGVFIGSGILLGLGDGVLEASSSMGLRLTQRRTDGEWWTYRWSA